MDGTCSSWNTKLQKIPYFLLIPGVEILRKGTVKGNSPETMRKLCLSTKFSHQEIRWNFGIFPSGNYHCVLNLSFWGFLTLGIMKNKVGTFLKNLFFCIKIGPQCLWFIVRLGGKEKFSKLVEIIFDHLQKVQWNFWIGDTYGS